MADRGEAVLRVTGEVRTLGSSVVDGLSARGERPPVTATGPKRPARSSTTTDGSARETSATSTMAVTCTSRAEYRP